MSESEDEVVFRINKSYAEKYDTWRRKEEYQQLIDKYGEDALDDLDGSSSSEEEDDDAQEITPEFEEQFLRALASVKKQDPKIYDKGVDFFQEQDADKSGGSATSKAKKSKPMYLKDYERKIIVEKGGQYSDDDEEEVGEMDEEEMPASPTYVEEQEEIKSSFKDALRDSSDEEESSEETFLTQKRKSKEEKEREEEEYKGWLKGERKTLQTEGVKSKAKDVESLREYWSNPQLEEDEKFLRDYILDRAYKPDSGEEDQLADLSDEDLSEDDRLLEEQEEFERRYNFRFEEPDSEVVKSYPRNVAGSLRKKDTSRTKKRQEVKERKEREKQKMREELKKLKNLKKMEIMEKLDKLKKVTGNATVGFEEDDMKGDFDPEQHEKIMQKIFDAQYDEFDEDATKPVFDDEELDEENWDEWTGYDNEQQIDDGHHGDDDTANSQLHCEDPGFNMDADYDPALHKKEKKDKRKKKKDKKSKGDVEPAKTDSLLGELDGRRQRQKHTSEFAKALQNRRPVFDPEDKTFEDYFEEYYRLDYEDLIGDLPCRFKYRTVVANDFGLSPEEVLGADDKELNRWAALRKTCQYRSTNEELSDLSSYQEKGRNTFKKQQILQSIYNPRVEEEEGDDESGEDSGTEDATVTPQTAKEQKKKHKHPESSQDIPENVEMFREGVDGSDAANSTGLENGDPQEADPSRTESRKEKRKKRKREKREKQTEAEEPLVGENVSTDVPGRGAGDEGDRRSPQPAEVSESKEHRKKNRKRKGKGQSHESFPDGTPTEHPDVRQISDGMRGRVDDHTSDVKGDANIDGHVTHSPASMVPVHKKQKRKNQSEKEMAGKQSGKNGSQDEKVTEHTQGGRGEETSPAPSMGTERGGQVEDWRVSQDDVSSARSRNGNQGSIGGRNTKGIVGDEGPSQNEVSKRSRKKRLIEELRERKRRKISRRKEISEGRLRAYGIRPTAYKYKLIQERIKNKRRGKAF